jgi:ribosomal protein S18 acetylase RimI-like enzyme
VAALTSEIIPLESLEPTDTNLVEHTPNFKHIMYLQTLAVFKSSQRQGIATKLLQGAIEYASSFPNCAAVYLHVLDTNESAITFYKQNKFELVRRCDDYYRIDGKLRTCFILIYYLNGARESSVPEKKPFSWRSVSSYIWSKLKGE